MRHYRILEKKKTKQYTIQYLTSTLKINYWKTLNKIAYAKYDEALTVIKNIITKDDYEDDIFSYHYIDAYKLIKSKKVKKQKM